MCPRARLTAPSISNANCATWTQSSGASSAMRRPVRFHRPHPSRWPPLRHRHHGVPQPGPPSANGRRAHGRRAKARPQVALCGNLRPPGLGARRANGRPLNGPHSNAPHSNRPLPSVHVPQQSGAAHRGAVQNANADAGCFALCLRPVLTRLRVTRLRLSWAGDRQRSHCPAPRRPTPSTTARGLSPASSTGIQIPSARRSRCSDAPSGSRPA